MNLVPTFLKNWQKRRAKRKENPLVVTTEGKRPIYASRLFSDLKVAGDIFGKKLKPGLNRVGKKEVWVVERKNGGIGVIPVVHSHGLRFNLEALDEIEKKKAITVMKDRSKRVATRPGWGSTTDHISFGKKSPIFGISDYASSVTVEGVFHKDMLRVVFIPPKTPFLSASEGAHWHKDMPAENFLKIQVYVSLPQLKGSLEEKKAAYKKRFPFLAKNVGFEFIEIDPSEHKSTF